jgi:hypothetical protein
VYSKANTSVKPNKKCVVRLCSKSARYDFFSSKLSEINSFPTRFARHETASFDLLRDNRSQTGLQHGPYCPAISAILVANISHFTV